MQPRWLSRGCCAGHEWAGLYTSADGTPSTFHTMSHDDFTRHVVELFFVEEASGVPVMTRELDTSRQVTIFVMPWAEDKLVPLLTLALSSMRRDNLYFV